MNEDLTPSSLTHFRWVFVPTEWKTCVLIKIRSATCVKVLHFRSLALNWFSRRTESALKHSLTIQPGDLYLKMYLHSPYHQENLLMTLILQFYTFFWVWVIRWNLTNNMWLIVSMAKTTDISTLYHANQKTGKGKRSYIFRKWKNLSGTDGGPLWNR